MECKCESCVRENCQDRSKQDDLRVVIGCSDYLAHKMTIVDRIRATDDVELMNRIYELHVLLSEFGHYELAEQFCDCKAECHDGEDCSEDRVKACILRWLQRSVE